MNRKGTGYIVSNLVKAEQSGNAKAVQEAYEELFTYCYQNRLDLNAVLVETKDKLKREAAGIERSSRSNGFLAFVLRQWPVVLTKLRLHLSLASLVFIPVFAGWLLSAPLAARRANPALRGGGNHGVLQSISPRACATAQINSSPLIWRSGAVGCALDAKFIPSRARSLP